MPNDPYSYIKTLLTEETDVIKSYEARTGTVGFGLLRGWALLKFWKNAQLINMLEAKKLDRELHDGAYRDMPALAIWAGIALVAWSLVWTAFVALTLADVHLVAFYPLAQQYSQAIGTPFRVGDFWGNLPGRAVAVTFAMTCVTYYINNFALIAPKQAGRKSTEIVMRACACLLPVPVLWATLYKPHAWPLCSGIGTLLVVLNNYLALRLAKDAESVGAKRFSTRGFEGRHFAQEQFEEWWRLMGAYSLCLILVGVLLLTGEAHDERWYALLVVAINVFKMYRLNCVKLAPKVRGMLLRDIFTICRANKLNEHGIPEPEATAEAHDTDGIVPIPAVATT